MKNKLFYMSMLLTCLIAACSNDEEPPSPTLSIEPSTALNFTAAATESFDITVTTNQGSWDATSNQAWCKINKNGNKFTVTATANTLGTSPAPATITISAGDAKSLTLNVTQDAANVSYPETETDLIKAIAKVWEFPEASQYISLELTTDKNYVLLSKEKFTNTRAIEDNIYVIEGTYTIESDLKTLTLNSFGKVEIKDLKAEEVQMSITPANGTATTITTTEQKIETPPTRAGKRIKTYIPDFGDEGVMSYTFTYDSDGRLSKLSVDIDEKKEELLIKYEGKTVSFNLPGEYLEATDDIICTYTLNTVGLATTLTAKIGNNTITQRYTYNNSRQLISVRRYEGGEMTQYCNATWTNGNVTSTLSGSKHTCNDERYQDNDGKTIYVHDHNQDGKFDDNDKYPTIHYDTNNSNYSYASQKNKGGFLIPTYAPDIFDMFDLGDWLAAMAGILGKLPENLNTDNSNGFFTFAYTFDGDYPNTLKVSAKEHGEEFSATMSFE